MAAQESCLATTKNSCIGDYLQTFSQLYVHTAFVWRFLLSENKDFGLNITQLCWVHLLIHRLLVSQEIIKQDSVGYIYRPTPFLNYYFTWLGKCFIFLSTILDFVQIAPLISHRKFVILKVIYWIIKWNM